MRVWMTELVRVMMVRLMVISSEAGASSWVSWSLSW